MSFSNTYVYKVLIACDQLMNAISGGYPDETLSSRTYRKAQLTNPPLKRWVFLYRFINGLFFFMSDHCKHAYETEQKRAQVPPDLRWPLDCVNGDSDVSRLVLD